MFLASAKTARRKQLIPRYHRPWQICEHLCYEYSRRNWIDARIVRLPTIMVRPGAPNTALSSYASGIVREPLKGQKAVCPVSMDFAIFISSPGTVVSNFVHLMSIDSSRYPGYTRTTALPGISVTTKQILDALEQVGGKQAVELVEVKPDVSEYAAVMSLKANVRVRQGSREI